MGVAGWVWRSVGILRMALEGPGEVVRLLFGLLGLRRAWL